MNAKDQKAPTLFWLNSKKRLLNINKHTWQEESLTDRTSWRRTRLQDIFTLFYIATDPCTLIINTGKQKQGETQLSSKIIMHI